MCPWITHLRVEKDPFSKQKKKTSTLRNILYVGWSTRYAQRKMIILLCIEQTSQCHVKVIKVKG